MVNILPSGNLWITFLRFLDQSFVLMHTYQLKIGW